MTGFGEKYRPKNKSKKKTNPPKEQIINQAIQFHLNGDFPKAAKYYQYCINQGFDDPRVFSNYAGIFRRSGKLKEAENLLRKALELNPDYPQAHSNLGNIFNDLGKLKDAELSFRKALELDPDFAEAHSNLGSIFNDLGKLKDAELSFRKALELNPDLAEAHSNLGNVLRDLGKLKELLLLSESTLKSRSINQGYKLLASLRITIANLLKKDFPKTLLSIKKTKELINQGAINTIKNEKNKKYASTFFKFITSLYPLLEKDNNNLDSKQIPHIGESHCLSFAYQTVSISSQIQKIKPVLITGGKAWHFASNKNNQWKEALKQQLKKQTYSSSVFISFGEIDCRKDQGILTYTIKKNKDISQVCKKTIDGYLNYMEDALSATYSEKYYFGIPAPTRKKDLLDDLDIKRIKIVKLYNDYLKREVLSRGSYFVDVYSLTSTINGENNNLYMCDQVHLSPKCLSILFKDHLYKT